MNYLKGLIEIKAQEIWMEHDSEMGLLHLFRIHWPYNKPRVLLNCVNYVNFKVIGHTIFKIEVIYEDTLSYLLPSFKNDELIVDHSLLFSKTYCPNNPFGMRGRFG